MEDPLNREVLLSAMHRVKDKHPFRHFAHVIMPDHMHWLFAPEERTDFSVIVAAVKRDVTWRLKEQGKLDRPLWQNRFYDHVVRDEDDFSRHLDYIHFNPVRHGLAADPGDYPWSSFSEWCKKEAYPSRWGESGDMPAGIRNMDLE